MKILVIGAGAIGGYYGGKLQLAGHEVYFSARGSHLASLRQKGLNVESIDGNFHLKIEAKQSFEHIPNLDLILVCVKMDDLKGILPIIRTQTGKETLIISLQNGVESDGILKEAVPADRLIGGIAFIGAGRNAETGKIRHTAAGFITIGELDGKKTGRIETVRQAFEEAGVECRVTGRIKEAKWKKLVWNVGFNGLAAITGKPAHKLLEHEPTRKIVRNLMEEVVAVAERKGIAIEKSFLDKQIELTEKMGEVIPSMLQDVRAGRKTEINCINGKIFREGQKLGVPTPYNEFVLALVTLIDQHLYAGLT